MNSVVIFFLCLVCTSLGAVIPDKVVICGVCKNIEAAVPNTIASITALGEQFSDYKVVIYENNSKDNTPALLRQWAQGDPHVVFLSEYVQKKDLARQLVMQRLNRTELIARARNRVLDEIMQPAYAEYTYVVWADLDILEPWDVAGVVDTIQYPEQEWDAVLANGAYDLFALRDAQFPLGCELLGEHYWARLRQEIRSQLHLNLTDPWRKVYSAFGGLGIYKRASIQGCRYSGVVTQELEQEVMKWLSLIRSVNEVPLLKEYEKLLASSKILDLYQSRLNGRPQFSETLGLRLHNAYGKGCITWFSCTPKQTLPSVCEHVPFHAAMASRGHDRIFINPRLRCNHP